MRHNGQLRLLVFGAVFVVLVVELSIVLRFAGGSDADDAAPLNQSEAVVTEPDGLVASPVASPQVPAVVTSGSGETADVAVPKSSSQDVAASQNDSSSPVNPALRAADTSTLSESTDVAVQRQASESVRTSQNEGPSQTVPVLPAADTFKLSESTDAQVRRSEPAPAGGGRGESIGVEESVEFIIRDSSGNIKSQGVAE